MCDISGGISTAPGRAVARSPATLSLVTFTRFAFAGAALAAWVITACSSTPAGDGPTGESTR